MPSQPISPSRRTISTGKRCSRSCSSTTGATSVVHEVADRRSGAARARARGRSPSARAYHRPAHAPRATMLLAFRNARAAGPGSPPSRHAYGTRRRRRCGRPSRAPPRSAASILVAPPPRRPDLARQPRDGARREPDRRPPAAPRARGGGLVSRQTSATASAGRATCTTSRRTPRASSRRTTTASPRACWRRSRRSAATTSSSRSSRRGGARSATAVRERLAERLPADAPLDDRVRELAVIQDEQGYLAERRDRTRRRAPAREHNCAIYTIAPAPTAACDAELDAVPGGPRRRRRARDAHRLGRPLLHVPGRGSARGLSRASGRPSGLFALHDLARRRARGAAPARRRRSARTTRPATSRRPLLLLDRQDPEPAERRQLVADVGLEHLRAVGVDREPDLVAPERVEDPAELVPAGHDPGVQVRRRADLEDDARARGSSPSPAGRRRPSRRARSGRARAARRPGRPRRPGRTRRCGR